MFKVKSEKYKSVFWSEDFQRQGYSVFFIFHFSLI